jgi:amino acid transporter
MVMGIVGGAIALIVAVLLFLGSVAVTNLAPWNNTYEYNYDYDYDDDFSHWDDDNEFSSWDDDFKQDLMFESQDVAKNVAGTMFLVPGIIAAVAGIMGLVGGIIVKKKNVAAGVLMIIAAVLSLFSFFNIVSMVLFILGGVFALMRERQNPVYAPPYPTPPYYPYAQQPYPQQPYPPQQDPQPSAPPPETPPDNPQP